MKSAQELLHTRFPERRDFYDSEIGVLAAHILVRSRGLFGINLSEEFRDKSKKRGHPRTYPFEHRVVYQFVRHAQENEGLSGEGLIDVLALGGGRIIPDEVRRKFPDPEKDVMAASLFQKSLLKVAEEISIKLYKKFNHAGVNVLPPSAFNREVANGLGRSGYPGMASLINQILDAPKPESA